MASNNSSSAATPNLSKAGRNETAARDLPARSSVWSMEARPRRMNSSFSVWRMWRRMAERARPVMASERHSGCAVGVGPRITSTTSPLVSGMRKGRSSPLIFTPTVVSPMSEWTA